MSLGSRDWVIPASVWGLLNNAQKCIEVWTGERACFIATHIDKSATGFKGRVFVGNEEVTIHFCNQSDSNIMDISFGGERLLCRLNAEGYVAVTSPYARPPGFMGWRIGQSFAEREESYSRDCPI